MTDNNKNKIDTRAETLKQSLHSIGKFQVVEKIDFGSAGTVFKCYDPVLRVYCAIKVPFDQSAEVSQQLTEARLQARLDHPNILQIRNVEKIDGKWVIVMNYAEGGNLRQKLANPKMISINDAVDYTRQIAGGLKKAHEHKILHHDIKPENILFSSEDTPMITDFGIARIVQSAQKDMSKIIGTAAYMAPEMLEGKADLRSDIWSLGVVFYEMLTGVRCLEGESDPETIKKSSWKGPCRHENEILQFRSSLIKSLCGCWKKNRPIDIRA